MPQKLLGHVRANVVAYLALFIALGGTSAYASHEIIDSSDIVDNSVATADLKDGDVRNVDLKPNAIGTTRVLDDSLTNADIQNGTLLESDINPNFVSSIARQDNSANNLGLLSWGTAVLDTGTAETLRVGLVGMKSDGSGGLQFCSFTSFTLPYVRYTNGARDTGSLSGGSSGSPVCTTAFDPGAGGDFEVRSHNTHFVGMSISTTVEHFRVIGLAGSGG